MFSAMHGATVMSQCIQLQRARRRADPDRTQSLGRFKRGLASSPDDVEVDDVLPDPKRPRKTDPTEATSSVTMRVATQEDSSKLNLLGLPGEIRNHIYRYLLPESPMQLAHYNGQDQRNALQAVRNISQISCLTRICRALRSEYFSLLLEQVTLETSVQDVAHYAASFDKSLKHCRASVAVICPDTPFKASIELLPLLAFMATAPNFTMSFGLNSPECICEDALTEQEVNEMTAFTDLCRTNSKLSGYVRHAFKSVTLHHPRNKCGHQDEENDDRPQDARLHIAFIKEHKPVWTDGTHNFDDLENSLAETGLGIMVKTLGTQVGLTTMGNKGYGRGFYTKEEQQANDWLLGRSVRPPKGVKRVSKMLRELE